ncbi:MAG: hypothetical protein GPJ54_10380 [Candidatus Heimdallarchaeota archaeon]|nr:hypothetical protein [Candidatus Heimdallarchaeota archaeon]
MKKSRIIIITAILLFSTFSILQIQSQNIDIKGSDQSTIAPQAFKYTPRGPIYIDGNSNFTKTVSKEGWSGKGTKLEPYIITGWEIIGDQTQDLITIKNTNLYFTITDNVLQYGSKAILLYNVTQSDVRDNFILYSSYGLKMEISTFMSVVSNSFTSNHYSIRIVRSNNSLIISNSITRGGGGYGINVWLSPETTISNNHISSNEGIEALSILRSNFTVISNNNIGNNAQWGVRVRISANITFSGNTVHSNGKNNLWSRSYNSTIIDNVFRNDSIEMDGDSLAELTQGRVENNTIDGSELLFIQNVNNMVVTGTPNLIIIVNSTNITVKDLTLKRVDLFYTNYSTIESNVLSDHKIGIHLHRSNGNILRGNTISSKFDYGILITSSENNSIIENNIMNTLGIGLTVFMSDYSSIIGNKIMNNGRWGLSISSSDNTYIAQNHVTSNILYDISHSGSQIAVYEDNIFGKMQLFSSKKINLTRNSITQLNISSSSEDYYFTNNFILELFIFDQTINIVDFHFETNSVSSQPLALEVTVITGETNLIWNPPVTDGGSDIVEYRIYRIAVGSNPELLSSTNQLYFTDTTVQAGMTYYYYVTAVNSVGESASSNIYSVTLPGDRISSEVISTTTITIPPSTVTETVSTRITETTTVSDSSSDDSGVPLSSFSFYVTLIALSIGIVRIRNRKN